jgi:vanillate O-demethylase ferredoxin subunit
MSTIPVEVVSATLAATDIRLVQLARIDGQALPLYQPGAHIDLRLGPSLVRQYSLCGPIVDGSSYFVAVKREPNSRGGSKTVHEQLNPGSILDISLPRNNFSLVADAAHSTLVAGGIGITPLISMARALLAAGKSFELHYFCRSADHVAFLDELEKGKLAAHTRLHLGLERDNVERKLKAALARHPEGGHLYLCGPLAFMDLVKVAARPSWPDECVHLEYFAADQAASTGGDTRFEVRLARHGFAVVVERGVTIVDALRAAGVDLETSCEQGVCGTCITPVLEGTPDHRDCFLTSKEHAQGECIAVCVSRSKSPLLVLDL